MTIHKESKLGETRRSLLRVSCVLEHLPTDLLVIRAVLDRHDFQYRRRLLERGVNTNACRSSLAYGSRVFEGIARDIRIKVEEKK
jgi:hypothetical protein